MASPIRACEIKKILNYHFKGLYETTCKINPIQLLSFSFLFSQLCECFFPLLIIDKNREYVKLLIEIFRQNL